VEKAEPERQASWVLLQHWLKTKFFVMQTWMPPIFILSSNPPFNHVMISSAAVQPGSTKIFATILGQIPFDTAITHAMVQAQTILEYDPLSETSQAIKDIWKKAENRFFSQ
jgi:hypothetical protein